MVKVEDLAAARRGSLAAGGNQPQAGHPPTSAFQSKSNIPASRL